MVLDTQLSEELIEEGFVREIISKVQTMRKDSGFEVMDNIKLYVSGNEKVCAIVSKNAETIKDEVLAVDILQTVFATTQKNGILMVKKLISA